MKKYSIFLLFMLAFSAFSQELSIEKNFEKNKLSYSLTRFSIGEDATSGWDYLVYRQKTSTKKIRVIWSNYEQITVDDYYYEVGKPLLLVRYAAKKSQYKPLKKGTNLPLKATEKFYFANSKLVSWSEYDNKISSTDMRWKEKEKEIEASFEEQLQAYRDYLEESK